MEQIILVVHLLTALAIIGLIMLQQGKGADMGASFGAGASQTLFGSDGSGNVLTRATGWLVTLFFATSFGLALLANQASVEVDELGLDIPVEMQQEQAEELVPGVEDLPEMDEEIPAIMGSADEDLPEIE